MGLRTAKTTLRLIALLALVLVLVVALFWRQLLTPQQKLRYGLTFEAAGQLHEAAKNNAGDKIALNDYVEALVREGNFGRAFYLMDLYGAEYHGPGAEGIAELRLAFAEAAQERRFQRAKEVRKGAAGALWKSQNIPAYQVLLYCDGYNSATVGDWHSAKEILSAIEPKRLAPPLRPYWQYFLARAYRLSGDTEQKKEVQPLLQQVLDGNAGSGLKARARYNLVGYLLEEKSESSTAAARKLLGEIDPKDPQQTWSYVKANMEFADQLWGAKDHTAAWSFASDALLAAPADPAAQAAGQLMLLIARDGKLGSIHDGLLRKWAESAVLTGYFIELHGALPQIRQQVTSEHATDLLGMEAVLYAAQGNVAALRGLTGSAAFAGAPAETKAEVRYLLAKLLAAKKLWNAAIAEFSAVAALNSAHTGEALLAHYTILKEVQEPLNLGVAVPLLQRVVDAPARDAAQAGVRQRAAEELIPLLINAGRSADARAIAGKDLFAGVTEATPAVRAQQLNWQAVGDFWGDYLNAGYKGDPPAAWSYYDVTAAAHHALAPEPGTPAIDSPEIAAEYLAGLGFNDEAREAARDAAAEDSPIVMYALARALSDNEKLPNLQWLTTEQLETGSITEPAVLRYVLELAYPTPYEEEVEAAAKARGVDPALIYAVMKKESNFKAYSKSGVGATGLMQLMPATANMMARAYGLPNGPLTEPGPNINLGTAYLASLQSELAGKIAPPGPGEDQHDALIRAMLHCYNGGPGNYSKWRSLYPAANATLLADLVPNEENEGFAKRVWKYYLIYRWRLSQTGG